MFLFVLFFGCGKHEVSDSGARSQVRVSRISLIEGNYGITNSPECTDNLQPIVHQSVGQIADCHNSVLKKNPAVVGEIVLETKIVNGKVMSVQTSSNSTGNVALSSCIENIAKKWKFSTACTAMSSIALGLQRQN